MDTMRGAPGSDPKTLHASRAEGEGARWWHRVTVSSGLLISSLVVVAMLVLSGLLAYQARTTAQQAIFAASEDSARHIGLIISERVRRMVDPADAIIRQLAFDPVTAATTLPARMRRLPVLARVLEQNALLSAAFIGYPDGQFLLVRPLRHPPLRQHLGAPESAA
ncbi:MAG: phosphohydrolase, partial [Giesbergeria sp.]|nr:phosphohydrolase [Giesbergeria sp.]